MADISHQFGNDLSLSASGALALVSGAPLGLQRVLRRLLTNPAAYIWQPSYGAGLGAMIGRPASPARIRAVVFAQIMREAAVAKSPAPVVTVSADDTGTVCAFIQYADAKTGQTQTFNIPVA